MKMLSCLISFLCIHLVVLASDYPAAHTSKIAGTPDLCQADPEGKFDGGGLDHCGPVSASNQLMWFARNGFPQLVDLSGNAKQDQIKLVHTLATKDYMVTADLDGTIASRFVSGLRKYVKDRGCKIKRLEYRGFFQGKNFESAGEHFTLDWIKEAVADPHTAVWLQILWFDVPKGSSTFKTLGGHWVSVVGYGQTKEGRKDPKYLITHDPGKRTGNSKVTHYVKTELMTEGELVTNRRGTIPAKGYFRLRDGQVIKAGAEAAVGVGAVVLTLEK